ncbi:MAG: DUF1059 domain-containing protein [Chitinophagaceae bacterium]|nr:DUF1059 domain-containing protein [Chitinophagaceae bacterium]
MKTMSCLELGGACDVQFRGNSFDELAPQSKKHGIEMVQKGDPAHLEAMNKMQGLMSTPDQVNEWMNQKRKKFDALPDVEYGSSLNSQY